MKYKILKLWSKGEKKFQQQFGFHLHELRFGKVAEYLHEPRDPSSLAATRILFGLAMMFDIPEERGGATMERRWRNDNLCHFPLLEFLQPLAMPYMALVYAALWMGAAGIMLGYKYHITSLSFVLCYWYLFLIEKSYWNNHSYLFGLVGVLLAFTNANCYWSIDAYLDPTKKKESIPYWNYFILKYQFFILYFMAGVKKGTAEWLTGYSVQNLSKHWVFAPFRLFLTVPQIDYLIVHWFIFLFDLTVAVWMMWGRTRHVAMVFCALFHLMNSRLFRIGMFPWVCLATMPLFYPFDWPKLIARFVLNQSYLVRNKLRYMNERNSGSNNKDTKSTTEDINSKEDTQIEPDNEKEVTEETVIPPQESDKKITEDVTETNKCDSSTEVEANNVDFAKKSNNFTVYMIIFYVITQAFLPFSHFITKGYNNWTDGLYGYSWDMMVHTWEPHAVTVKVVDNESKHEIYVDPWTFTPNDRWSRHGDMIVQYAHCIKDKIQQASKTSKARKISKNISIYIDVWYSLNGRFAQRMFNPEVDMLTASWSPFEPIPYLMPLLDESAIWREALDRLREDVNGWSNYSDVNFFAEYPGFGHEKYIPVELENVTLVVLEGVVSMEPGVPPNRIGQSTKLTKQDHIAITPSTFHKVINIGNSPAFFMYTFYNRTYGQAEDGIGMVKPKLPIISELLGRFTNMIKFGNIVIKNVLQMFWVSECQLR